MLSVGSIFSKERKRLGLSRKDIEQQTRIREKFIEALEENQWSEFSSKIYITGLIKNYAKFLELDPEKMIAYFRRDYERREEVKFKRRVESKYFKSETKKIILAGITMLVLVFAVYFGFQVYNYISPPEIRILAPSETEFRSIQKVAIRGVTEPDATVTIFGERVYQNEKGEFDYDLPLSQGTNNVTIEVVGANGRTTTIEKTFILR